MPDPNIPLPSVSANLEPSSFLRLSREICYIIPQILPEHAVLPVTGAVRPYPLVRKRLGQLA